MLCIPIAPLLPIDIVEYELLWMNLEEVLVSFAYVSTAPCLLKKQGLDDHLPNGKLPTSGGDKLLVSVKYVDHRRKCAVTQTLGFREGEKMSSIYRAIYMWLPMAERIICFAPVYSPDRLYVRNAVDRVLLPDDDVPELIICQDLLVPLEIASNIRWVAVNVLAVSQLGHVTSAGLPLLVGKPGQLTVEDIISQIAALVSATPAQRAYISECSLVSCVLDGNSYTIRQTAGFPHDDTQVAILHPLLEPGDVVQVNCISEDKPFSTVQAVVLRHTMEAGMLRYDVHVVDVEAVLYGLDCWQVVPL